MQTMFGFGCPKLTTTDFLLLSIILLTADMSAGIAGVDGGTSGNYIPLHGENFLFLAAGTGQN